MPKRYTKSKYEEGITLITPTGDRHIAFSLCERWMSRQTYNGPLQWIVIDDGKGDPIQCTMGQEYHHRPPRPNRHTLQNNFLEALKHVKYNKVLVIEDDDWYHPQYVEMMANALDNASLVGQSSVVRYNVTYRRYYSYINLKFSPLAHTGFSASLIPEITKIILLPSLVDKRYIDRKIWKNLKCKKFLGVGKNLFVSIKGLPGRSLQTGGSITKSLQKIVKFIDEIMTDDKELVKLKKLIGDDIKYYEEFYTWR